MTTGEMSRGAAEGCSDGDESEAHAEENTLRRMKNLSMIAAQALPYSQIQVRNIKRLIFLRV